MSDEQILKAMQTMLEPIKEDLSGIKQELKEVRQDVSGLKEDVSVLKEDVSGLKEDVSVLKQDVSGLKQDVSVLKQDMGEVKQELSEVKQRVTKIEMVQENEVDRKLKLLIEAQEDNVIRFKAFDRAEKTLADVKSDTEVIKAVMAQHSQSIRKLELVR